MAHFAQLDDNNNVINVTVVANVDTNDADGNEVEEIGIRFLKNLFGENTRWVKASYNGNIRRYFPSIGWTYHEGLDIFVAPKPFNSWIFNEETGHWEAPVPPPPRPEIDMNAPEPPKLPMWDEESLSWKIPE